jgi:hypothetical protein
MILQSGNQASNSGMCPTSTGNLTQARSQPLKHVISSIKIPAIAPKLLSDFLILQEITSFNSGSLAASMFTKRQKTLSKPGIFFLARHSPTISSTF